jgi:hypothetical protein
MVPEGLSKRSQVPWNRNKSLALQTLNHGKCHVGSQNQLKIRRRATMTSTDVKRTAQANLSNPVLFGSVIDNHVQQVNTQDRQTVLMSRRKSSLIVNH